MTEKSLQVKITADVTSLAAGSAIAKAELNAVSAEMRDLARQSLSASDDMKAGIESELRVVAARAVAAQAEVAKLKAEMAEAGAAGGLSGAVANLGEKAEALTGKLSVVTRTMGALSELALTGLGLEAVGEGINHVAETGEQLQKLSEETGLSTEELSALRVMAIQTGTDFDQFTTLLQRLPNTLQGASTGTGKAAEAFRAMGVQVTDSTGQIRPMGEIVDEVAAKLYTYADGANKTALETDIFGSKIGASLLPMLNQLGQTGLPAAIDASSRLGQTWSGEDAEAATHFEDDLNRVGLGIEGIAASIIKDAIPALDQMAQAFSEVAGTATLGDQIATVQAELANAQNNRGRFSTASEIPHYESELATLQAQQKAFTDGQVALTGGAAAGSVTAPQLKGGGQSVGAHQGAGGTDVADDGDNTDDFSDGGGGGGGGRVSAAKNTQDQVTQIAADAAAARKQIQASEYDGQVSVWNQEVATGALSKAQEIQNEEAAQTQMYDSQLAEMQKEAALDADGTAAKAKALDDIAVLTAAHNADMARLNADLVSQEQQDADKLLAKEQAAAAATSAAWQRAFEPVSQAFDESINGILQGTQTLQGAELQAAQSIALAYIDAAAKKVVAFVASEAQILVRGIATETGLTAATAAGNASRLAIKAGADATGKAEDVALGTAQINSSAMKAAAGAYSAVVGIPIIGPALGPIAAATAYAGVMAFDVISAEGGAVIPAGVNPLAQLHENEMVLPAYIAQPLQSMVLGDMGGGGDSSVVNNVHLNASGGAGGISADSILSTLNAAFRSGSFQRYPAIARAMRRG